jgi:hypothetical protein
MVTTKKPELCDEFRIFIVCSACAADVLITQLLVSQLLVQPQLPSSSYDE